MSNNNATLVQKSLISNTNKQSQPGGGEANRSKLEFDYTSQDDINFLTASPACTNLISADSLCEGDETSKIELQSLVAASKMNNQMLNQPLKKKKKRRKKIIGICTSMCKYESVRRTSRRLGMKEMGEDDEWTIFWTDYSVNLERVMDMKRFQKINHFPGMTEICRKDFLARNLNRLQKLFPKEYACFPKTWCLPADFNDFQAYCRAKKNRTFICKPESGCQGKGIFVTKGMKDIKHGEHMICQQYITKALLIDGFKFDLRLYVLVTSCDPLRIFMYKEGLGRFATKKYQEPNNHNLDEVRMHLTNYAINKHSDDFIRDDEEGGSKRKLANVCAWLDEQGYDVARIWENIEDVVIKTLISAHPVLKHNYRSCFPNHMESSACFEILGFDVMLDRKLKAWVLEVNHSPSFHTDAKLDKEVKEGLLTDTFNLLDLRTIDRKKCLEQDKRRVQERLLNKQTKSRETRLEEMKTVQTNYLAALEKHENENMGGFRRIYPRDGDEKYQQFFESCSSLLSSTAATEARREAAKMMREEIRIKQVKNEAMLKGKYSEVCKAEQLKKERETAGESGGDKKHTRNHGSKIGTGRFYYQRDKPKRKSHNHASSKHHHHDHYPTHLPVDINEKEEMERISGLIARDTLVRNLGVVDLVHRLVMSKSAPVSAASAPAPAANKTQIILPNQVASKQAKTSASSCSKQMTSNNNGVKTISAEGGGEIQFIPNIGLKVHAPSGHYFTTGAVQKSQKQGGSARLWDVRGDSTGAAADERRALPVSEIRFSVCAKQSMLGGDDDPLNHYQPCVAARINTRAAPKPPVINFSPQQLAINGRSRQQHAPSLSHTSLAVRKIIASARKSESLTSDNFKRHFAYQQQQQ